MQDARLLYLFYVPVSDEDEDIDEQASQARQYLDTHGAPLVGSVCAPRCCIAAAYAGVGSERVGSGCRGNMGHPSGACMS